MPRKSRSSIATPIPQISMPCKVQEDDDQRPVAVRLFGREVGVAAIDERWEDEEFWWRDDPVVRITYQVTLEDGGRLTIFKNMLTGGWYMAPSEDQPLGAINGGDRT